MPFIDYNVDIWSRITIELALDFLKQYARSERLRRARLSNNGIIARCRFKHDREPSFTLFWNTSNMGDRRLCFKCYSCGEAGGDFVNLIAQELNCSDHEAALLIKDFLDGENVITQSVQPKSVPNKRDNSSLYSAIAGYCFELAWLPKYEKTYSKEREYLYGKSGRVAESIVPKLHLGVGPSCRSLKKQLPHYLKKLNLSAFINDALNILRDFEGRVVIPVIDENGNVVSFVSRALDAKSTTRYKNSGSSQGILYGLHLTKDDVKRHNQVIVVEGAFDFATLLHLSVRCSTDLDSDPLGPQANIVSILGSNPTRLDLEKLSRYAAEIVFCYDGDLKENIEKLASLQLLASEFHVEIKFTTPPNKMDPDEYIKSLLKSGLTPIKALDRFQQEILSKADTLDFALVDYHLNWRSPKPSKINDWELWERLLPIIEDSKDKKILIKHVANSVKLSIDDVEHGLTKARNSIVRKEYNETEHVPHFNVTRQQLKDLLSECNDSELLIWLILAAENGKNDYKCTFEIEGRTLENNSGLSWRTVRRNMDSLKSKGYVNFVHLKQGAVKFKVTLTYDVDSKDRIRIPYAFIWKMHASKVSEQSYLKVLLVLRTNVLYAGYNSNVNIETLSQETDVGVKQIRNGIDNLMKSGYVHECKKLEKGKPINVLVRLLP